MAKKGILIGAHSQYRAVYSSVAKVLQTQGSNVHLSVATAEEKKFYETRDIGRYASITVANWLYGACRDVVADPDAVLRQAAENEKRLGATYNEIMLTDRHLGRGYALGGFRHPRSKVSEETSYIQAVHAINKTVAFWEELIERADAGLIINCGKIGALIARMLGIPYRVLAASRYKNYHYWAIDEYFRNPEFASAYAQVSSKEELSVEAPYATHLQMRTYFSKHLTFQGAALDSIRLIAQRCYWRLRGYEKAKYGYYLLDEVAYLWRRYNDMRQMAKKGLSLDSLKGQRFIYYPLHTEPESALQMLSPKYFSQLNCIASLARDAPAGVLLAVKETVAAAGRRPRDFYDQIAAFKNVVFIDPNELGLRVISNAATVATITGTGGFEAAAMGKPVISFGQHNIYNFLPHVSVIANPDDLATALQQALGLEVDHDCARRDGARFLCAISQASFDLEDFSILKPDEIDQTAVEASVRSLLTSVPTVYAA